MRVILVCMIMLTGSFSGAADFASSENMVRRLFLDLYNRLPQEKEYLQARKMINAGQTDGLINTMLKNEEYRRNLAGKIIDHFAPDMPRSFDRLYMPLANHIVKNYTGPNKDFRQFLFDYLTAEGIQYSNPMTIFYASDEQPPDMASRISQRVVGLPYNCARCHDHKDYEGIKHQNFWEFASFFNTTGKTQIVQKRQMEVVENAVNRNADKNEKESGN